MCSPRSALMVVSFLLQRAACDANTLFAPTVALLNPHGPLSVARGLRRQVIRARCLQPGRTTTASSNVYFGCCRTNPTTTVHVQLFLFCNCRGLQASGGASASWDSIIRPSQVLRMYPDSSGLGNSNCGSCILGNSNHKRPVVAPKPTNFELITKDYHEHKSRLQIFIDST